MQSRRFSDEQWTGRKGKGSVGCDGSDVTVRVKSRRFSDKSHTSRKRGRLWQFECDGSSQIGVFLRNAVERYYLRTKYHNGKIQKRYVLVMSRIYLVYRYSRRPALGGTPLHTQLAYRVTSSGPGQPFYNPTVRTYIRHVNPFVLQVNRNLTLISSKLSSQRECALRILLLLLVLLAQGVLCIARYIYMPCAAKWGYRASLWRDAPEKNLPCDSPRLQISYPISVSKSSGAGRPGDLLKSSTRYPRIAVSTSATITSYNNERWCRSSSPTCVGHVE